MQISCTIFLHTEQAPLLPLPTPLPVLSKAYFLTTIRAYGASSVATNLLNHGIQEKTPAL
jgi:hypothetical protein